MVDPRPTWQLVDEAARRLSASSPSSFRLRDLIAEVQTANPERERGSIQPVVQGMTINAGQGPPSPCGKILLRVSHGQYALRTHAGQPSVSTDPPPASRRSPHGGDLTPSTELVFAGPVTATRLHVAALEPPPGRVRHQYGHGPFAVLQMPSLP